MKKMIEIEYNEYVPKLDEEIDIMSHNSLIFQFFRKLTRSLIEINYDNLDKGPKYMNILEI